jgi:plasmid stability protein
MANLTIRNVPEDVVERLKATARRKGHSMEQEVRELLMARFADRTEIAARIRKRWETLPPPSEVDVEVWRRNGRP